MVQNGEEKKFPLIRYSILEKTFSHNPCMKWVTEPIRLNAPCSAENGTEGIFIVVLMYIEMII